VKFFAFTIAAAALMTLPAAALADSTSAPKTIVLVDGPLNVVDAHGVVVGQLVPTQGGDFHFQFQPLLGSMVPQGNPGMPRICPPKGYTMDLARALELSASDDDLITPLSECAP
jgi:hypothetical protein